MDESLVYRLWSPTALPGSYVRNGYALKASKREANFKIRFPTVRVRPQEDYLVDRSKV